jgi:hypothetical protein
MFQREYSPSSSGPSFASAVLSGIARAKAEGVALGRPSLEHSNAGKVTAIKAALADKKRHSPDCPRVADRHRHGAADQG